jgi:hypothetical protein
VTVLPVDTIHELYPFELTIQPNPISDILTLKTDVTIEKCEIFDAMGRIVQKVGEVATSPTLENQINVSNLPKGIYFIKVYNKDGFAVRKFVKA